MLARERALVCATTSIIALSAGASSALTITETDDALALANTLFLNTDLVLTGNVSLSGDPAQSGIYQNASGTYGLPPSGIVLSTGSVADYVDGPNESSGTTTEFDFVDFGEEGGDGDGDGDGGPIFVDGGNTTFEQNEILNGITGQFNHFDVVELDIEFFAQTSEVTFFATFGSEEFPEFQGSSFIDGFGLFVNDVNVASVFGAPVNINHPSFAAIEGTELDGILAPGGNSVMRFDVPVNAGELNDFKIILGDASDASLDTTVYLSSFFADPTEVAPGETQFNPLLPVNDPDPVTGQFVVEVPVGPNGFVDGDTVWLDPPVLSGYTYEIDPASGVVMTGLTAPSLATVADLDGYTVTVGGSSVDVAAGETIDLAALFGDNVTSFTLTGIDTSLNLDENNPLAFPLGVSFTNLVTGLLPVTITPLTTDVGGPSAVPLPAGSVLLLSAFGLGGVAMRRRRKSS